EKTTAQEANLDKLRQSLGEREKELIELLAQYKEEHPVVVAKRQAVNALKESIGRLHTQDVKAPETQVALRRLLTQLGVNMDVPGKAVFYTDLTGILMVRATAEDLAIVQAAIETLGGICRRVSRVSGFGQRWNDSISLQ